MVVQDFEDWLMGLTFAAAAAVTIGAHILATPIAGEANAAVLAEPPQYALTITAKRIPAECKGLDIKRAPAHCAASLSGDTTWTMTERGVK
jgi:hypothetical protein